MNALPFISVVTREPAGQALTLALEAQSYPAYSFETLTLDAPHALARAQGTLWVFLAANAAPEADFLEGVAEAFADPDRRAWVATGSPTVLAVRKSALPAGWEGVCLGLGARLKALALELSTRPGTFCDAALEGRRGAGPEAEAPTTSAFRDAADAAFLQARYGLAAPSLGRAIARTAGAIALLALGLAPLFGAPTSFLWAWAGLFVWHATMLKSALVAAGRPLPPLTQLRVLLAGSLDGPLALAGHAAGLRRARRKPEEPEDLLEGLV